MNHVLVLQHIPYMKRYFLFVGMVFVLVIVGFFIFFNRLQLLAIPSHQKDIAMPSSTPEPTISPTYTPTPTPRPLTFAEMNALYGPCAVVPTLLYHHIQNLEVAKKLGHEVLTVDTANFQKQMQYLFDAKYTPIRVEQLIAFFDASVPLPTKPVLITFDDGYDDFGIDAAPILQSFGYPAVVFIPTGLMENPGYMTWQTVRDIASRGLTYFANHTWSHKNVQTSLEINKTEIGTADSQLTTGGLNQSKVFAYPYGNSSSNGQSVLNSLGYSLAFTTNPGSIQCKKNRLVLPRIRIGNANLNAYGL